MMISHGGGSIPYQIGRWRARWFSEQAAAKPHIAEYFKAVAKAGPTGTSRPAAPHDLTTFDEALRQFYFDTDLHEQNSLELLLKTVGSDRCLFGTERPGSGNAIDPRSGRSMEDIKYTIDRIEFLESSDRELIYEMNARKLFPRLNI
jgi:4-oxalmesaconate hydratase